MRIIKFDIGDVVMLKSGGPKMTVEKYVERQDYDAKGVVGDNGCSGYSGCCSPSTINVGGPFTAIKVPMCRCVYFIDGNTTPLYVEFDDKLLEPAVMG